MNHYLTSNPVMKKNTIPILYCSLVMFLIASSPAGANDAFEKQILAQYPQFDTNGDGKLSKAEEATVVRRILERFPDADTDGDGALSDEEKNVLLQKATARMNQNSRPGKPSATAPTTDKSKTAGLPVAKDLSSHGVTQDQLNGLDAIMLKSIEKGTITGCSFLVAHKGEIIYRKAHGAFTTDERVPLASVSKPLAASVIMALAEQGKLDLEDPVAQYLPEFKGIRVKGSQTPARPMTIRHTLSHMAGFWGNKKITPKKMGLIRHSSQTLEESVKGAAKYELIHEPGTKWTYSGIGYCVAGRVAEAALGDQSFEQVAQDALFRRLGMNDTTFAPTPERPFILVGGSLQSTLDNMAVFGQMHLNDGVYNGKQILSKASVTDQRRLQIPEERFRAPGLGWHRGSPDENGLADLVFISGATGPRFQVDRRRQTVTIFLVRTSLQKVVPLFTDLNQHVEEMFPITE
ncbi:serine hydrolase [Verrucomicrobia bacterium]|nr:serine hydrolase [Verrucomicrobiota bacterium]